MSNSEEFQKGYDRGVQGKFWSEPTKKERSGRMETRRGDIDRVFHEDTLVAVHPRVAPGFFGEWGG